jgi:hypothetical protein
VTPQVKIRDTSTGQTASADVKVAADAYFFGYPLVVTDATRRLMTAVPRPGGSRAPVNQFAHRRALPDPTSTAVVSPNSDTLYSTAWLDLTAEPIVLSLPEVRDRYYLMQLLDAWTNVFASLGTRTTGRGKGDFAIVGPRWVGIIPAGLRALRSPTNMVWLIGRTQTNGRTDYATVHALQNRYTLTPLSAWDAVGGVLEDVDVDPTGDTSMTPVEQVARMDAAAFFERLNSLMTGNPPSAADAPALKRFASVGIGSGRTLVAETFATLGVGVSLARDSLIAAACKQHGELVNGWEILPSNTGRYGTDYLWRAVVARLGLGANLQEDAAYLHTTTDADGQPLTGANKYVVRFAIGTLPPVRAFWSITMYNARQAFVDNVLDRYAIGDRDNVTFGNDGSLTLFIQHESPGIAHSSNWLPSPTGSFNLLMRLYWPTQTVLGGRWKPPAVERV